MKLNQNYILAFTFAVVFQTVACCQINSDSFVSHSGDLLENTAFTIKNEINDEEELVTKMYFDESGRIVFQRNYDFNGELMYDNNGIAVYEFIYDEHNNIIEERYYDEEKNFFQQENIGAAMIKRQFNNEGRMTEIAYFIENGMPLEDGTALIKYEYSADGSTGMEKHFNSKGALVDFCAPIIGLEFDTEGQVVRKVYMNNNEEICNRFMDGDEDEVSMIEYDYDGLGNISTQRAFNKSGKLLGTINS
jgi:hypothetical protein